MKRLLRLSTPTLLAVGLLTTTAQAEFDGYYALDNPGPGGRVSIPSPSSGPVAQGNWNLWSEGRSLVEFQRSPTDSASFAVGFTLTVKPGGSPGNVGSFEILQMPASYPNPGAADVYTFTYNFGFPVSGNEAWYVDADGQKPLVGHGQATFKAPRGDAGQTWGFYVKAGSGNRTPVLQIQDWPSAPVAPVITSQPQSRGAALGESVALAVSATGTAPLIYQWQKDGTNLLGAGAATLPLPNFQASDAGVYQVVVSNAFGVASSTPATLGVVPIIAWGNNGSGQTNVPVSATNLVAVAAGYNHSLSLRANGTVVAWGDNYYGQTKVPVSATNLVAVAAGGAHSLGLRANGTVVAWGSNNYGQTNVPANATNIAAVAAGGSHSLGLRADGTVLAWGNNDYGQRNVPASATNIVAVAAGNSHNLGLRANGTVLAWGNNGNGQTNVPASATNIVAVAAGYDHSLGLRANGTVLAWGNNGNGQTNVPVSATNIVAVAAGGFHSLGLRANGTAVAWGDNSYGQTTVPPYATNVIAVAGGGRHSLALIGSGPPIGQAQLQSPQREGGTFSVSIQTQSGRAYALDYKSSLDEAAWTSLPLTSGNGGTNRLTDPSATNEQRFYRVRRW